MRCYMNAGAMFNQMWVKCPRITSTELHFFYNNYTLNLIFNFPYQSSQHSWQNFPCFFVAFSLMNCHSSRVIISYCIHSFLSTYAKMFFQHETTSDWQVSLFDEWNPTFSWFYNFFLKFPNFSVTDKRTTHFDWFPSILEWLGTLAFSNFKDEWKT